MERLRAAFNEGFAITNTVWDSELNCTTHTIPWHISLFQRDRENFSPLSWKPSNFPTLLSLPSVSSVNYANFFLWGKGDGGQGIKGGRAFRPLL